MEIELVVFDLAGTTVAEGGAVYRCLRDTLDDNGLTLSAQAVHQVAGMDKREALQRLIEGSPLRDELLPGLDAIHEDFVERMIAFYQTDPSVAEMPGARATFQCLRAAGIKVAVNTGFSRAIAQTLIDRFGWERDGLLDASITSDEVAHGRPHPDMIRHLMARLGITDPQRIAKVGDAPADLLEGKHAGCGLIIGVTQGASTRQQLQPFPHDYLIGTVAELPKLLALA